MRKNINNNNNNNKLIKKYDLRHNYLVNIF